MAQQLALLELPKRRSARRPAPGTKAARSRRARPADAREDRRATERYLEEFQLDPHTREIGRQGVAEARQILARVVREAAERRALALGGEGHAA